MVGTLKVPILWNVSSFKINESFSVLRDDLFHSFTLQLAFESKTVIRILAGVVTGSF